MSRHTVDTQNPERVLCGRKASLYAGTEPNGTPCRVCARVERERARWKRIAEPTTDDAIGFVDYLKSECEECGGSGVVALNERGDRTGACPSCSGGGP